MKQFRFVLQLLLLLIISTYSSNSRINDNRLLTSQDKDWLENLLNEKSNELKLDLFVLINEDVDKYKNKIYLENFFYLNRTIYESSSGVALVLRIINGSVYDVEFYFYGNAFDDSKTYILNEQHNIISMFRLGNYRQAYIEFVRVVDYSVSISRDRHKLDFMLDNAKFFVNNMVFIIISIVIALLISVKSKPSYISLDVLNIIDKNYVVRNSFNISRNENTYDHASAELKES